MRRANAPANWISLARTYSCEKQICQAAGVDALQAVRLLSKIGLHVPAEVINNEGLC